MKTLNLYLSSTNKIAEGKIINQFYHQGEKEIADYTSFLKNEPSINKSDVFILYLGDSKTSCFDANINECRVNRDLQEAINCKKDILLAYAPKYTLDSEKYLFYKVTIKQDPIGIIRIKGLSGTALKTSEVANLYSRVKSNSCDEIALYSAKCTEHKFEENLLLNTKVIFNEELLLIN